MHVLMLGWEFPPLHTGGLGTACRGLTGALGDLGVQTTFVLPSADQTDLSRAASRDVHVVSATQSEPLPRPNRTSAPITATGLAEFAPKSLETIAVTSDLRPYVDELDPAHVTADDDFKPRELAPHEVAPAEFDQHSPDPQTAAPGAQANQDSTRNGSRAVHARKRAGNFASGAPYRGDLHAAATRYAHDVAGRTAALEFDVIHAHDWLTFEAGVELKRRTGRPLVVHVHSTEFDRAGPRANPRTCAAEHAGIQAADAIIAVSLRTREMLLKAYDADPNRIFVIYNGVESVGALPDSPIERRDADRVVLFMGRLTEQKGPAFFLRAAKRVLEVMPDARFVMAGSGDQTRSLIEEAARLGIGHRVLFTGFLAPRNITRMFAITNLYVMPSVSEPFGITPLEALDHGVPVLISRQSGVAEILNHVLKADFWNVDELASKIIAVLRYPLLRDALASAGADEVRHFTWRAAAQQCRAVYQRTIDS